MWSRHASQRPEITEEAIAIEASLHTARTHNPRWLQAGVSAQQAELSFSATRIDSLPDLDLSGGLLLAGGAESVTDSRQQVLDVTNPTWSIGAGLSIPIPARAPRADRTRARLSVEQARLVLEAAEQDLIVRVQTAVNALHRDRARVQLARQTLEAAQLALAADQELHREGLASTREVILSLESLNEAQVSMLSAQIDLQSSTLSLMRIEGVLLERLAITPP